jgi:Fe-S-cluster-containing dehydrogenase component/CRP-like cAMP-binding protein
MTAAAWPEVVWDASMLRGLDPRARGEIEAAGRLRDVRAGEVIYRPGDPADALYVIASGRCELLGVRRGDADSALIRQAKAGDVFGEEGAVAAFSTRQLEARCERAALIAEVPLVVLKRAAARAGGADRFVQIERALRRAATLDLLRTIGFTRALSDGDLDVLLDAARHVHVDRGEHVYREDDEAGDAFFVVDGLLQAQTTEQGKPRIEAYLTRGDLFGDEELEERRPRGLSVVASGPTWLVAIPRDVFVVVARRNHGRLDEARRLRSGGAAAEKLLPPGIHTTAHVFRDLYRLRVARSLLVIDQDSCIRCGHCAWSCADIHEDGVSRLVRRGDKIIVDSGAGDGGMAPLLVPNSCQHCKNPSCMIDCPTGAIGRDARGEVFIREDLCTGCGSCAKGCPWENIQMAPRKDVTRYAAVAVKCDLCKGASGGPACVASCPTQAIARIDPNAALVELRGPMRTRTHESAPAAMVLPRRIAAWPFAIGGMLSGVGLACLPLGRWATGVLSGALIALLVSYALTKRVRGPLARLGSKVALSRLFYIGHLSVGAFAVSILAAHARAAPPNVAGALTVAITLAVVTGALGAAISTVVPRILSRMERKSVLPEELAVLPRQLDEQIYGALSGKSELVKTLFATALRPYRRAPLGPAMLLVSGRSLREEEKAIRARLDRWTGGKTGERVFGLDELVRLVVEHRAVRAQRLLTWVLRGWLVPHLAATAAALVLLVLHLIAVTR